MNRKEETMYKTVWWEYDNAGLKYMSTRIVRSRRKRARRIDWELCLDRAATAIASIWTVVLLVVLTTMAIGGLT